MLFCMFNSAEHFNRGNMKGGIFILCDIISVLFFSNPDKNEAILICLENVGLSYLFYRKL